MLGKEIILKSDTFIMRRNSGFAHTLKFLTLLGLMILCVSSVSIHTSQGPIKPLREQAADTIIKKWLSLPATEFPFDQIEKLPVDIKNELIRKIRVPVYQFFVDKVVFGSKGEIDSSITLKNLNRDRYADVKVELLPNEDIVNITYGSDTQRALIQVNNSTQNNGGAALFYMFDYAQKKYRFRLRFSDFSHSTLSKNGRVIGLCKFSGNQPPHTYEIQIRSLQENSDALYKQSGVIKKKLSDNQVIEKIELNDEGSLCVLSIKERQGHNVPSKLHLSLWEAREEKVQEIDELKDINYFNIDDSGKTLLVVKSGVVILYTRNDQYFTFNKEWERAYPYFAGAALNSTGDLIAVATEEDMEFQDSTQTYVSGKCYVRFKEIIDGEDKVGYKEEFFEESADLTNDFSRFQKITFASPNHAALFLDARSTGALFDGKNVKREFAAAPLGKAIVEIESALFMDEMGLFDFDTSLQSLAVKLGKRKVSSAIIILCGDMARFCALSFDAKAVSIVTKDNINYLRYYTFAGEWTDNLKVLRETNLSLEQALLLGKIVNWKTTTTPEIFSDNVAQCLANKDLKTLIDALPTEIMLLLRTIPEFEKEFNDAPRKEKEKVSKEIIRKRIKRIEAQKKEKAAQRLKYIEKQKHTLLNKHKGPGNVVPVRSSQSAATPSVTTIQSTTLAPIAQGRGPRPPATTMFNRIMTTTVGYLRSTVGWMQQSFWGLFGY